MSIRRRPSVIRYTISFFYLLPFAFSTAYSQGKDPQVMDTPCEARFSFNAGYMMTNNSTFAQYNTATYGIDGVLLWRPHGDSYWQHFWKWPYFGVKGSFAAIPHCPAGHRFGLTGLLVGEIAPRLEWQVGLGLSFYTKPHQFTHDTTNIFIGSFVNCFIDIGTAYRLSDQLLLSLRILHTSNGMLMRPNQGLNFFQADVAWRIPVRGNTLHVPQCYNQQSAVSSQHAEFKNDEWSVAIALGTVMSRDSAATGYFPCFDISAYYQRYLTPTFAYGAAIDLWSNFSDARPLINNHASYRIPLYLSALATAEAFFGPLSIKAGLGPVILSSYRVTIPFYERVGAYYNFGNNYTGVALNAHGGRIEFIEWTFGHRF
ncbi:MAG: acyloxyacyl hydrolase [Bacteroidales bacterium]|nr:acyloxyacyl hydrolase [Bacteroidales bacterium]